MSNVFSAAEEKTLADEVGHKIFCYSHQFKLCETIGRSLW